MMNVSNDLVRMRGVLMAKIIESESPFRRRDSWKKKQKLTQQQVLDAITSKKGKPFSIGHDVLPLLDNEDVRTT
jgi:hypothetical protein